MQRRMPVMTVSNFCFFLFLSVCFCLSRDLAIVKLDTVQVAAALSAAKSSLAPSDAASPLGRLGSHLGLP